MNIHPSACEICFGNTITLYHTPQANQALQQYFSLGKNGEFFCDANACNCFANLNQARQGIEILANFLKTDFRTHKELDNLESLCKRFYKTTNLRIFLKTEEEKWFVIREAVALQKKYTYKLNHLLWASSHPFYKGFDTQTQANQALASYLNFWHAIRNLK